MTEYAQRDRRAQIDSLAEPIWVGKSGVTPIGVIWVGVTEIGLVMVEIGLTEREFYQLLSSKRKTRIYFEQERVVRIVDQIMEYLDGKRRGFEYPIDWRGMRPFQEAVLRITWSIPYGCTTTYGEIAQQLGKPGAARAVGRAEATNPLPLVIPCHRVIGTDGKLHGFGAPGGIEVKRWLLEMERGHGW